MWLCVGIIADIKKSCAQKRLEFVFTKCSVVLDFVVNMIGGLYGHFIPSILLTLEYRSNHKEDHKGNS